MKILSFLFSVLLLIVVVVFPTNALAAGKMVKTLPSPSPTAAPVDSYKLFWPITAGKVMGESMYSLKILKENIRGFFVFSELKKSEYNMTLSEKRTVEAEKLFVANKDYVNGRTTLDIAHMKREMARDLLDEAQKDGKNVIDLKRRLISSFERQKELLAYVAIQVPDEQKAILTENVSKLDSVLATLQ